MSVAFVHELQQLYPDARISVIAKKGIHDILTYFPVLEHQFIFSKEEYKGFAGLLRFGRMIKQKQRFDLFFSLPDSFSSALIGFTSGAKKRVGYKKELRSLLLTHAYARPTSMHRVQEYLYLLTAFAGHKSLHPEVRLVHSFSKKNFIVVNINSEASSRRLTVSKAVEEISALRSLISMPIYLIGAPKEKAFVDNVFAQLSTKENITNIAGQTPLPALIELLASAQLLLSTDSGPAHLANALGTRTVVLFGAGNENNTAPFNAARNSVIRLGQLSCEPCLKNTCARYEVPQCLQQLDSNQIARRVKAQLETNENR